MEFGSSLPVSRQCALLQVSRSSAYYTPNTSESAENLALMRRIDEQYLRTPFYGVPRMTWQLNQDGYGVNHKRVARLMSVMGLQATLPGPHTSRPRTEHVKYPYLLGGMKICGPCEVWSSDITYIPMQRGFMYLVAVMDWFSRYVIAWDLSNSMGSGFCVAALGKALRKGHPQIFNTDQGSQFTSAEFTDVLKAQGIQISMDGRGRCHDNIFVERLWWTVKHEWVYLRPCENGIEQKRSLTECFEWYNRRRPHQSLNWQTPDETYFGALAKAQAQAA